MLETTDIHSILLMDVAPKVAEMLRTNPRVADLIDPAVYVEAADDRHVNYRVVERLQLIEALSGFESEDGEPLGTDDQGMVAPIAVLVVNKNGMTTYAVPDPRTEPASWPWMGLEGAEA
jgi:hypothetical protein